MNGGTIVKSERHKWIAYHSYVCANDDDDDYDVDERENSLVLVAAAAAVTKQS